MENGSMWNGETQVASYFCFGRERDFLFARRRAGARDLERQRGGGFDALLA